MKRRKLNLPAIVFGILSWFAICIPLDSSFRRILFPWYSWTFQWNLNPSEINQCFWSLGWLLKLEACNQVDQDKCCLFVVLKREEVFHCLRFLYCRPPHTHVVVRAVSQSVALLFERKIPFHCEKIFIKIYTILWKKRKKCITGPVPLISSCISCLKGTGSHQLLQL